MGAGAVREDAMSRGVDADAFTMELLFGIRRQRNVMAAVACGCLAIAALSLGAVIALTPLKQVRPYVVMIDRATGAAEKIVEVQPVDMAEIEAVRQAELVRYVTDRETYHVADNAERIPAVLTRSTAQAEDSLRALWTPSNADYPPNLYGEAVVVRVVVRSVAILSEDTAQVRFSKTREAFGETPITRDFVATLTFEFRPRVERRLEAVWRNPLGFTVTAYRVDAETLSSRGAP
jgi:type IV secretion system protein VirB8